MPTPVQVVPSHTNTTTITATGGSGPSGLIVCAASFNPSGTTSFSGCTAGGTAMTLISQKADAGNDTVSAMWYLPSVAAGVTSVVVSGSNLNVGLTDGGVCVIEVPGSLSVDKHPTDTTGTSSSYASGSTGTLSQAVEFAVGTANAYQNPTNPSGWTDAVTGATEAWNCGYRTTAATTALTYSGTKTGTDAWTVIIATFIVGAGAANTGVGFLSYLM